VVTTVRMTVLDNQIADLLDGSRMPDGNRDIGEGE
jgi:hypothetical protein